MQERFREPDEQATQSPTVLDGKTQVLGLDYKTAGILCYLPICAVNLITSLVVINSEPKSNYFLRFHAMQSLILCVVAIIGAIGTTIITTVLGFIPLIGWAISLIVSLAWLVAGIGLLWMCILGMIAASKGEMKRLPYIGQIAEERLAAQ